MTHQESAVVASPVAPTGAGDEPRPDAPRRRALSRTLGVAAVVAVIVLPCASAFGRSKITWENYARIGRGMTYDQVKAVLGPQRAFHQMSKIDGESTGRVSWTIPDVFADRRAAYRWEHWPGDEHVILVVFDESGAAVGKSLGRRDPNRPRESFSRIQQLWKEWKEWVWGPEPAF